jgi:peptide/nickel transport system substrate-binding protein
MVAMQWVGVTDPDMLRRVFHSAQTPPSGFNRGYYSNPEVDRAIDRATTASTEAERKRHYAEAQRLVARDAPYISLWHKRNIAIVRPELSGLRLRPQLDFLALSDVQKDPPRRAAR